MRVRDLAPLLLVLSGGCLDQPRPCVDACVEARVTLESCLAEWGLEWGDELGYLDGDDYDNWCSTFIDEQLEMATSRWGNSDGQRWVEDTCGEQRSVLETGSCDDYLGSWGAWDLVPRSSSE